MAKGKRTKKEMIDIVGTICGTSSIAYMNIRSYSNAEDYQVKIIFDAIIQREIDCINVDIAQKQEEIKKLKEKLKEFEKYSD